MMPKIFRVTSPFILTFIIFAIIITNPVMAQGTCPAVIQDAIRVLGNSCERVGRNNACYGNVDVDALFVAGQEAPFRQVGDLAQLANLQRITTSPVNRLRQEWGIALLSVQANIPDTVPGQAVVFLLMGDAEMENAVQQDGTVVSQRFPIVTRRSGSLRSEPSASSRIITFIPGSTQVQAERLSDDGDWLRVVYNGQRGWIIARMADSIPNFAPATTQRFTPMQSFYLRTGIGQPDCIQAPNTLMVQSPRNFSIDITVNGADIRVGSTVFLRNIADDVLQLIVAEGQVTLYPDTPNARILPAGSFSTICLDEPQDLGVDGEENDREVKAGCFWTAPRPFTDWGQFIPVATLAPDVILYEFDLPIRPIITADCTPNEEWLGEYTVIAGDTLTAIAPRYNLTPIELGFGNCLTDYDLIRTGQILRVPLLTVGGGGDMPPPVSDPPVIVPTPLPPIYVDLALTVAVSDAAPEENSNVTYTVSVSNIGTQDATGVVASAPFPDAQMAYINAVGDGIYDNLTGVWSIGTIPVGATATLNITATARPGQALQPAFNMNSAITALNEPDIDLSNNNATVAVNIGFYTVTISITGNTLAQANDGVCTLIEAINNANNNTAATYAPPLLPDECPTGRAGADVITLNTSVDVDAPLPPLTSAITINGGGVYEISRALGQIRLFDITAAGNVTFSNITLADGAPAIGENGGAIYNEGTVTLGGGTNILNNTVTDASGAGVYNLGTLIVDGTIFSGNTVNGTLLAGGGAIKNLGTLTINNSTFNNNAVNVPALGQGGAISSSTTVTLNGCNSFNNNTAFTGGAIHLTGGNLNFTATCNVFNGNSVAAGGDGGALYLAGGGTYVVGGQFIANITAEGRGGAIFMTAGTLTVNASTFQNNFAQGLAGEGGVLYVDMGIVTFNGSSFVDNNSGTTNGTIVYANTLATANFFTNTINPGHNTTQCDGTGTFADLGGNGGGDGSCY